LVLSLKDISGVPALVALFRGEQSGSNWPHWQAHRKGRLGVPYG
jgi:hypothetical protein